MSKSRIVVLGSTGSIGESAFRVLSHCRERFEVIGLAARGRIDRLAGQAGTLHAKVAVTSDPGKLADLVMLDRDLYRINPADIDQARVLLTVVDGRVVWEAK